jgi:hypothetical protein
MFNSPFANDIFLQATFTFKVRHVLQRGEPAQRSGSQNGVSITDGRGNIKSEGEAIAHTFKLSSTNPNLRREYEVAQLDELYYGVIVDGDGTLDPRIQPSDVGVGEIKGKRCICNLRSLAQSSIKLIPKILGEKYLLLVTYRVKGGV